MKQVSGYKAYWIYLAIKFQHFKGYDITHVKNNKKFLKKWNSERKDKDGFLFQKIQSKFNNTETLKLLFGTYYVSNISFYPSDILNDNFSVFLKNVKYLKNVEENFTNDLKYYMMQNTLRNLLVNKNSLPPLFKDYRNEKVSINFLTILNKLFNIEKLNKGNNINSLEKETYYETLNQLKMYELLISEFIDKHNWKEITKKEVMLYR